MKTYKLYTFSSILIVKNCKDLDEALDKAKLNTTLIWKSEEIK